jgi:hypothetical protein
MALAVPSGLRAIAAMNKSVMPDVTTPSRTHVRNVDLVKADGRGRTISNRMIPAQNKRIQAAPSTPSRSTRPSDSASPTCTLTIDAIAIATPILVCVVVTQALNGTEPFAST